LCDCGDGDDDGNGKWCEKLYLFFKYKQQPLKPSKMYHNERLSPLIEGFWCSIENGHDSVSFDLCMTYL